MTAQDEFDAILGADAGVPRASESTEGSGHAHETQRIVPSFRDFAEGWHIYRDPVLCGGVAGLVLGVLGVFVVLRRAVFVTAAVTQAAGLGVAAAFLIQLRLGLALPPVLAAFAFCLGATSLLALGNVGKLSRESLVGFAYLATSAFAVLVGDRITQGAHDIAAILFGSAVLVRPLDLTIVLGAGALVLAVHVWCLRGLVFSSFDPEAARVQGLPVRLLNRTLFLSIGLMVGVSARALGALPVFAFSVLPATTALLAGARLPWAFALATAVGVLSGAAGYLMAFFWQFPVGGSQTVVAAAFVVPGLLAALLRRRPAFRTRRARP